LWLKTANAAPQILWVTATNDQGTRAAALRWPSAQAMQMRMLASLPLTRFIW